MKKRKENLIKLFALLAFFYLIVVTVNARPEYLKIYAANPFSRPELRSKCSVCHVNPQGGGERNAFGKAFINAGFEITPELRKQFPDRFVTDEGGQQAGKLPISFVEGSDAEAIVEMNGRRYVINTRTKSVKELEGAPEKTIAVTSVKPKDEKPAPAPAPDVYRPVDVRLINLPTAMPIAKGSLWTDFTHRFPFSDPTDSAGILGLDSLALPSFGFTYGLTDRIHIGSYRSPGDVGRPILFYAGASLLNGQKGDQVSLMARVGREGRDNVKRNFTTSFEFSFARSITRHAQIYVVPKISVGDRPINSDPKLNLPGETAFALGIGAAVNIRPSVALMAEANYRLNEAGRYPGVGFGIRRPVVGFGIQKASASRKHAFSLTFTNGPGTTFSQRSQTRGLFFADDTLHGLTIGFNLSRRLF